jgi:hypothetical protein
MGKEDYQKKIRDFQIKRRRSKKRNLKALLERIDENRRRLYANI